MFALDSIYNIVFLAVACCVTVFLLAGCIFAGILHTKKLRAGGIVYIVFDGILTLALLLLTAALILQKLDVVTVEGTGLDLWGWTVPELGRILLLLGYTVSEVLLGASIVCGVLGIVLQFTREPRVSAQAETAAARQQAATEAPIAAEQSVVDEQPIAEAEAPAEQPVAEQSAVEEEAVVEEPIIEEEPVTEEESAVEEAFIEEESAVEDVSDGEVEQPIVEEPEPIEENEVVDGEAEPDFLPDEQPSDGIGESNAEEEAESDDGDGRSDGEEDASTDEQPFDAAADVLADIPEYRPQKNVYRDWVGRISDVLDDAMEEVKPEVVRIPREKKITSTKEVVGEEIERTVPPIRTINRKADETPARTGGKKAQQKPIEHRAVAPDSSLITRRHVIINRSNVANMFNEYLKNRNEEEKERLEGSISTIILK